MLSSLEQRVAHVRLCALAIMACTQANPAIAQTQPVEQTTSVLPPGVILFPQAPRPVPAPPPPPPRSSSEVVPPPPLFRARPPVPLSRPGDWARDGDYPPAALRNHVDGITGFVLAIPTTGVPEKCTISRSSGSNELDTQACNLMMQRARFKPAIDAEGNPISGTYSSAVRWKAPIIVPPAPAFVVPAQMPMTLVFSYDEETDGSITHCSIERVIGAMDAETASSRLCQYPKHRAPYLNNDGKPVRRHIVSNQVITVTDAP